MATNPIPTSPITFEVYLEDERLLGCATATLPELDLMTVEVAGSGVSGKIDYPLYGSFENLELKLTFRVLFAGLTSLLSPSAHMITLRTAVDHYDAATGTRDIHGLKIVCRGLCKNLNNGELNPGEAQDAEVTMNLDYYKIEDSKDGVLIEIDKFNAVYNVNDIDYYAVIKDVLGL